MVFGSGVDFDSFFDAGAPIEIQLGLSIAVLLLVTLFGRNVLPVLVRWAFGKGLTILDLIGLKSFRERITLDGTVSGFTTAAIHLFQIVLFGITVVLLLWIWGQFVPVLDVLAQLSIPTAVLVKAGLSIALVVGAYAGMGRLHYWVNEFSKRSDRISAHQEEIWLRVLQIIFLIAATIVALSLWGIDLGGLLVGAGFLGIVAGLAAQQTLGSLISGFVLMLSRPFEIGDWVKIGDQEGIITEITIVNTRLENFDGELIALPNDVVGNSTIINRTSKGRLRLRVEVGIDYDEDPEQASEIAVEALNNVERVLSVPRPRVVMSRFDDSAIVLELRFWIDKPSARRRALAQSGAIEAVTEAFREEGIKIPFPQRELSGRTNEGGFRVIDDRSESG